MNRSPEQVTWTLFAQEALREVWRGAGTLGRTGWRPAFCWVGCFILLFAYVIGPSNGVSVDLSAVNALAAILLGAFVMRGLEKANTKGVGMGPGAQAGLA